MNNSNSGHKILQIKFNEQFLNISNKTKFTYTKTFYKVNIFYL